MANTSYFSNFNIIDYANTPAVDITERIIVTNNTIKNPFIYYPYDIKDGQRPDNIAYKQFGDPYTDWIILLTNNIIDPYYDWYMTEEQFIEFITDKYGSLQIAQTHIMEFQTDWIDAPSISIAAYDALDPGQQQYYTPNYNNGPFIINYIRKELAWSSSTNMILDLSITGNSAFIANEVLSIVYDPTNNPNVTGSAQAVISNSTNIICQHVFNEAFPNGNVVITSNSYVYGTESGANCLITACGFVSNNIPLDQIVFWSPVYYYDYERIRNETNRTINILDPKYVQGFLSNAKALLEQVAE